MPQKGKLIVAVPEGWEVLNITTGKPADVIVKHVPSSLGNYEGQAHYMSKAAHSLINMLNGLDYSKFGVADAGYLTTSFHQLIKYIEAKKLT